jgi:hypothetical protein
MDQQHLDAIRARCEAATPGPWELTKDGRYEDHDECRINLPNDTIELCSYENGEFIAHARTDVPDLLAEVEQLTQYNKLIYEFYKEKDEKALKTIQDVTADRDAWRRKAECMESRLASMTAERDALIASLRNNDKCETCMHSLSDGCSAIRNGWRCRYVHPSEEWRGPEVEKE